MDGSEETSHNHNKVDAKLEVHPTIFKLKKEDDDEQWISGEELYTDGSSDEDGTKGVHRKNKREHKGARPKQKTKISEPLAKPALVIPVDSDEEPIDISWKPKRGSIKLPHMSKDEELKSSGSSTSKEPIKEQV